MARDDERIKPAHGGVKLNGATIYGDFINITNLMATQDSHKWTTIYSRGCTWGRQMTRVTT
jgi:hypothetical protein